MRSIKLFLLITLLRSSPWTQAGSLFKEAGLVYQVRQVNAVRKIAEYTSHRDVSLAEYDVPPETSSVIFGFSSVSAPESCSRDRTVVVYVQYGGFPLFSPTNSPLPGNAYGNRTNILSFQYRADATTHKLTIPAPTGGLWYSAVFIKPQEVNHGIKQTGLFTKCELSYYSSFLTSGYTDTLTQLNSGEGRWFLPKPECSCQHMFKLILPESYFDAVDITLNCNNGTSCPQTQIRARSGGLPLFSTNNGVHARTCDNSSTCNLVYAPKQRTTQYILVKWNNASGAPIFITATAMSCRKPLSMAITEEINRLQEKGNRDRIAHKNSTSAGQMSNSLVFGNKTFVNESAIQLLLANETSPYSQPLCPFVVDMSRIDLSLPLTSAFGLSHSSYPSTDYVALPTHMYSDTILRFDIVPYKDTGGTLYLSLNLTEAKLDDLENFTLIACLSLGQGSRFEIEDNCGGPLIRLNKSLQYAEAFVPYPEVGTWNINIQGRPLLASTKTAEVDEIYVPLQIKVKLEQCVKETCGPYGSCIVVRSSGVLIISSCNCAAGYKGWDCSDGSEAQSSAELYMSVIFLTISNLLFIPAGVVAIRRKHYTEAAVYFCTCFFSSFYHACDQPLKSHQLCIMEYRVLQFCDFYVSILSFWVTIIAMADLPYKIQSLVHILGCIGIALGVEYDKTGLWTFVVPAITAVVILGASWGFRSYRMKMVAPRKRYWLVHFLPGFCFATLGLILFAAVETKRNYKFVHSIWHIAMALSVICLLPPMLHRHHGKYPKTQSSVSSESDLSKRTSLGLAQDVLLHSPQSQSPTSQVIEIVA
ncbi:hypothetical protein RvY_05502 [Ramazzottius varieornatus]|uniref:EGF-like domain-containing protein n=1 Tax=Ramazzottius varieornatus TaxID=947166 RepID=A0A1D1UYA9_RAMVA|nr:hypothetical protein RvY_05502 [Ramazzottius varieornatus]